MLDKKHTTDQSVLKSIEKVLASRPDLASRIDSILEIVDEPNRNGEIRSADEVESLLVQELRKLGNESLVGWSAGADKETGKAFKAGDKSVKMREKKLYSGGAGSA